MSTQHGSDQNGLAYEQRDLRPRVLVWSLVGFAALVAISLMITAGVFRWFDVALLPAEPAPSPLSERRILPPAPNLQVDPTEDLEALKRAEAERLNKYGWVNREAGVVHVPIDVAMDKLLEKGFPARDNEEQ